MLVAKAIGQIPGKKILIVKQSYMYDLSVEKNVINFNSNIAEKLKLNEDITTYQSVVDVLVIGISDAHFPDLSSGVAYWVDNMTEYADVIDGFSGAPEFIYYSNSNGLR